MQPLAWFKHLIQLRTHHGKVAAHGVPLTQSNCAYLIFIT